MLQPAQADPELRRELQALVVEDSTDDFEMLLSFLARGPWKVEARRVEDEAGLRAALEEKRWDVIISDHFLPRFDSVSALLAVREQAPEMPFIIVSGEVGEEVAVEAMLAGADDYVMKHNLARLRPAIERCLATQELRCRMRCADAGKRESDARLAAIAANLPGVIFQLRHDVAARTASFVYLSRGATALLGRPPEAFLDNPELLFELTSSAPGESLSERLAACGRAVEPLRWEGSMNSGGGVRWLAVSALPRSLAPCVLLWDGIMTDITAQKAIEDELRTSRARLSELSAHWDRRAEEERAEIARELHDEIGGTLAALKIEIDSLRRRAGSDGALASKAAELNDLVQSLLEASTRVARALRSAELDHGIATAIRTKCAEFERRFGMPCRFGANEEELALAPEQGIALFRVLQEALTNIAKHAGATRVEVELFATEREVTLEVRDDGRGLGAGELSKPGCFGVRGMGERVGRLGGWVEVSGEGGKGTTVMVSIPRLLAQGKR